MEAEGDKLTDRDLVPGQSLSALSFDSNTGKAHFSAPSFSYQGGAKENALGVVDVGMTEHVHRNGLSEDKGER